MPTATSTCRPESKGGAASRSPRGADGDVSVHARRVRGRHPGHLRRHSSARRPGVYGRREHERAGRAHEPGDHRRRRLPPQPPQDIRDSARRRWPRHGTDRRRRASRAVSSRSSGRARGRLRGDSRRIRRALGIGEHPADFLRLHPHAGRRRHDERDEARHSERELHQEAARAALRRAVYAPERHGRARDDFRSAALQGLGRRRARRREAADGLRLPRADRLVPGRGHADDRADGKRIAGRARSLLRRDDCDSAGDSGGRRRQGRSERQRAEECAAHRRGDRRRQLGASVQPRAGGVSAAVRQSRQVLAADRPHRQRPRRSQSHLHLPGRRGVRQYPKCEC